jgi:RecA-family ATPase
MAQKVIAVVVAPNLVESVSFKEYDFPDVSAALADGYFVRDIKTLITETGRSRVTLVFVLER